jgi:hypothetical protein
MDGGRRREIGAVRLARAAGACFCAFALPACFGSSSGGAPDGGTAFDSSTGIDSSSLDTGKAVVDSGTGSSVGASADGAVSNVATLFVPDDMASSVYRYSVTSDGDPVYSTTIHVPSAVSTALSPTGELFVTSYEGQAIYRFVSPLGALTPNGMITGDGLASYVEGTTFVDDQLWVANYAGSNLIELAFDAQRSASVAGMVTVFQPVGILWDPLSRILYVSEPSEMVNQVQDAGAPLRTVQHYKVSTDHVATALTPIPAANPYGMAVTPWGELLVTNGTGFSLTRFSIDAQGNATPNGTITGNGFSYPLSLTFAPWGELFVGNQGTGTLSRFTFDSSHNAVPNGTFQTKAGPAPNGAGDGSRMDWIAMYPGASGGDGGVTDSGVVSDAASE